MKFLRSLHDKKGRQETGCFIAEGKKVVEEALESAYEISFVVTTGMGFAVPAGVEVYQASEVEFKQISTQSSPEGVLAVLRIPKGGLYDQLGTLEGLPEGPAFFLDGVQDPGNLGTIMRIADWFGFKTLVCKEGTADCFNPKVLRASMGSLFRVRLVYVEDWAGALKVCGGQMSMADMEGHALPDGAFLERPYILLGNESHGVSGLVKDVGGIHAVTIPQHGGAESLNVAISAGILAYEWTRGKVKEESI